MDASTLKGILKLKAENHPVHKKNTKKGRLIIRNLSFKVTKQKLTEIFGKFGNVTEVNIPTQPDGKKRGFGFVQYDNTGSAIRAINELNAKNILDRPVAVDFAVAKNLYDAKTPAPEPEMEVVDDDFKVEKTEPVASDSEDDEKEVKPKIEIDSGVDSAEEDSNLDDDSEAEGSNPKDKSSADSEDDDEDDSEDSEQDSDSEPAAKKQRSNRPSDAEDGRTLFIRNLSFQSHEEDLEELFEPFGEVQYVVLCHDPLTGLPRGTGFVRFSNKEEAVKCLDRSVDQLQGGLFLDNRQLTLSPALAREHAKKATQLEDKTGKDKRNLYLAREGLVRQGTLAAQDISKTDLALRARLEVRKKRALRNLHYFVSRTRLCVHNLPPGVENKKLRSLFLQAANDRTAKITEARVMKENNGYGKSKGFGFVEFTEHGHALTALRQLNNNPNIFTSQRRPIVEFSVENRSALNAKVKRQERAKVAMDRKLHVSNTEKKGTEKKAEKLQRQLPTQETSQAEDIKTNFSGFKSKKDIKNLPSHTGPKIRHKKAPNQTKPSKAVSRTDGSSNIKENPKKKKGKRKGNIPFTDYQKEKTFQTLVNKYKTNLSSVSDLQKQKWYDGD